MTLYNLNGKHERLANSKQKKYIIINEQKFTAFANMNENVNFGGKLFGMKTTSLKKLFFYVQFANFPLAGFDILIY